MKELLFESTNWCYELPHGLAVRISGFHPGGPGSTPGVGNNFHFLFLIFVVFVLLTFLFLSTVNILVKNFVFICVKRE